MRGDGSFQLVRREIFLSLAEERYRHRVKMANTFRGSTILNQNQVQDLKNVLGFPEGREHFLYRGSTDSWSSAHFHHFCDDQGPTVTVIKAVVNAKEYIFGGYTDQIGIVSSKIDLVLFFFEIHVGKLQQEYSNNLC